MPKLQVEGFGTYEVAADARLIRAIEDNGVDILHRCGGYAKCTTCLVEFLAGEPDTMTVAERDKLQERGLAGQFRLACQILCDHDMHVKPGMLLSTSGLPDPGPAPEATITPPAEWTTK